MLSRLKHPFDEVARLHSKLVLLIGPPGCGKTALVLGLAEQTGISVTNVGLELGRRLSTIPQTQRRFQAGNRPREIAEAHASGDLLLIDNIEVLFDASLALSLIEPLKRLAHARLVVAVWPGKHRQVGNGRRRTFRPSSRSPARFPRMPCKKTRSPSSGTTRS